MEPTVGSVVYPVWRRCLSCWAKIFTIAESPEEPCDRVLSHKRSSRPEQFPDSKENSIDTTQNHRGTPLAPRSRSCSPTSGAARRFSISSLQQTSEGRQAHRRQKRGEKKEPARPRSGNAEREEQLALLLREEEKRLGGEE